MTDFVVGVKLTADSKELVGATSQGAGGLDKLGESTAKVSSLAKELNAQQQSLAQTLAAQSSAWARTDADIQKVINRYDPLGAKLRSLESDFEALSAAAKSGGLGAALDPAVDLAYKKLGEDISAAQAAMAATGAAGAKGMEDLGLGTQMARREITMLAREAITGDFSRMPITFGSLVTHSNLLQAALTPVGLGILAVAAAAGTLAYAFIAGEKEMRAMNNAIGSTNDFAGMTRGGMVSLAESVSAAGAVTIGTAKDIVTQIVASGRYSSENVSLMSGLVENYATAMGNTVDQATPKLIKMFEDPAKASETLNQQLHYLKPLQMDYIKDLQEGGDKQAAATASLQLLNEHLGKQAQQLGLLTTAWNLWKQGMASIPDRLNLAEMAIEQQLQKKQEEISNLQKYGASQADIEIRKAELMILMDKYVAQQKINAAKTDEVALSEKQHAADEIARQYGTDRIAQLEKEKARILEYGTDDERNRRAIIAIDKEEDAIRKSANASAIAAERELARLQAEDRKGAIAGVEAQIKADFDAATASAHLVMDQNKEFDKLSQQGLKDWFAAIDAERESWRATGAAVAEQQIADYKKVTDAAKAEQKKQEEDFKRSAESINHSLTDAILRGFEAGKGFAQNFWDTLKHMAETTVLKPVIQYVLQPVSGAIASGLGSLGISSASSAAGVANAASGAGSGLGSIFSAANSLGSIFGGPSLTTAFSNFGTGISTFSTMMGEGAAATEAATAATAGLGASFATLIPYVGLAIAAFALFSKHSTPSSSTADIGQTFDASGNPIGSTWSTFGAGNGASVVADLQAKYSALLASLGGSAASSYFYYGANTGAGGQNPQFRLSSSVGGHTFDTGPGETPVSDAAMQLAASRAVLSALQGSDLPGYLSKYLSTLSAADMNQAQIDSAVQFAQSLRGIHDALTETRTPMEVLTQSAAALEATLHTSGASFKTDFLAAIDAGITPAALAQWQQLASLIDNVNSAIAALEKDRASILESFMTPAQKYAAAQNQINTALDKIGYTGPRTVDAYTAVMGSLDLNTEAGRGLYAVLAPLAGSFHTVTDDANAAALAAQQLADKIKEMHDNTTQYLTAAQRQAEATAHINSVLDSIGYTGPRTAAAYNQVMAALHNSGAAGLDLYNMLLPLGPEFALLTQASNDLTDASTAAVQAFLNSVAEMQANQSQYFWTPAQRTAAALNQINTALDGLGYTGDRSVDTYNSIMASLDLTTAAGRGLWAILWPLRDAFNTLAGAMTTTAAAAAQTQSAFEASVNPQNFLQQGPNPYDLAAQAAAAAAKAQADAAAQALADQQKIAEATRAWTHSLADWLNKLALNETLSPLTGRQRFDEAQRQYVEDLMKAQGGDAAAQSRYTADAEAYLREALSMFGRASTDYNAIYRAIRDQAGGLIDQAGPDPIIGVIQDGARKAQAQADELITRVNALIDLVDKRTAGNAGATDAIVGAIDQNARDTVRGIANAAPGGRL